MKAVQLKLLVSFNDNYLNNKKGVSMIYINPCLGVIAFNFYISFQEYVLYK